MLILVVEDDQRMLDLLCRGLRDHGHTAMPASDGAAGLDLAETFDFDAIVLDVGLPIRDGCEIARLLRAQGRAIPILMLTARDAEDDIILGLESGADDYLLKPFSFPELVARLHRLCRTNVQETEGPVLALDPLRLSATRGRMTIPLTRTEYLLLSVLYEHAENTVSRSTLIQTIWGEQNTSKANALDVLVNALRTKLDEPFPFKMVTTIRGFGYRLVLQGLSEHGREVRPTTAQSMPMAPEVAE